MTVLQNAGIETRVCLPFEVDRTCDLPRDIRFSRMDRELPNADMVICFGGDGTILHIAKQGKHVFKGGIALVAAVVQQHCRFNDGLPAGEIDDTAYE